MEEDQKLKYTCKFCGKTFPCGRSLGGHMRSHLITVPATERRSEYEAKLCKKKRSNRPKRSPSDQQEQEEVALSLILLSMESSIESKLEREAQAPRKRLKSNGKLEIEVNSPKALIKGNGSTNPFGSSDASDHKKRKESTKTKCINSRKSFPLEYKFSCMICKKGFPSYQALGGHRASHKKFKGCCAPASDECKKSEDHERPSCSGAFPSSRALGGHDIDPSGGAERSIAEIHSFLDLNLPAPVEEDCNELKPWWISSTSNRYLLSR